jgi:hypothetical protein
MALAAALSLRRSPDYFRHRNSTVPQRLRSSTPSGAIPLDRSTSFASRIDPMRAGIFHAGTEDANAIENYSYLQQPRQRAMRILASLRRWMVWVSIFSPDTQSGVSLMLVPQPGFELGTHALRMRCSTN